MDLQLRQKIALVSGSSKGLGFATVKALLREGANAMINSRSQENVKSALLILEKETNKETVAGYACDVTKESDCKLLVKKTISEFGKLDILITNSGGPPPGKFIDLSTDQWKKAIDLSFLSHLYLIKESLPYLKKSTSPSILAITSFTVKNPLDNLILSNTVRAATAALIKSLSIELGKDRIRLNSILPGWTKTERVNQLLSSRAEASKSSFEKEIEKITDSIPLGRMGTPEEFANAATFLVSPAASYINGIMINVDGGITKSLF